MASLGARRHDDAHEHQFADKASRGTAAQLAQREGIWIATDKPASLLPIVEARAWQAWRSSLFSSMRRLLHVDVEALSGTSILPCLMQLARNRTSAGAGLQDPLFGVSSFQGHVYLMNDPCWSSTRQKVRMDAGLRGRRRASVCRGAAAVLIDWSTVGLAGRNRFGRSEDVALTPVKNESFTLFASQGCCSGSSVTRR